MSVKTAIQIIKLAISLFQIVSAGAAGADADVAKSLTDIVRAAEQAHLAHFGQPIDTSLIKPEAI